VAETKAFNKRRANDAMMKAYNIQRFVIKKFPMGADRSRMIKELDKAITSLAYVKDRINR